eukprot:406378-Hanusia_phi.AAC.1
MFHTHRIGGTPPGPAWPCGAGPASDRTEARLGGRGPGCGPACWPLSHGAGPAAVPPASLRLSATAA